MKHSRKKISPNTSLLLITSAMSVVGVTTLLHPPIAHADTWPTFSFDNIPNFTSTTQTDSPPQPTTTPTADSNPTPQPSAAPTSGATPAPTTHPTSAPNPTAQPTNQPPIRPSTQPTTPATNPTVAPTSAITPTPTITSIAPIVTPTPTPEPTNIPTGGLTETVDPPKTPTELHDENAEKEFTYDAVTQPSTENAEVQNPPTLREDPAPTFTPQQKIRQIILPGDLADRISLSSYDYGESLPTKVNVAVSTLVINLLVAAGYLIKPFRYM